MNNNHETKHDPSHPAGTPQSPETGGNLQRVPADSATPAPYRINPAWVDAELEFDFSALNELHRAVLRAASYARACRSRAAVLCASTDACSENPSSVYRTVPGSVSRAFDASAYVGESEFLRTEDPS